MNHFVNKQIDHKRIPILKFIWFSSFLMVLLIPVRSQDKGIYFQQISNEDNLSQSTVNAILKDRVGFMWFGTEDGLNLYDGYQLKVYKHEPEKDHTISSSAIWSIFEDRSGSLWIGTFKGLNRYIRETDSFASFLSDPDTEGSLSDDYVRSIVEDNNGILWVGTNMGLNRFDAEDQTFTTYLFQLEEYDPNGNIINAMVVDHLGNLWVGTNSGLHVYDEKSDSFFSYDLPSEYSKNWIISLYEDSNGVLWVGTDSHGLFTFNRRSSTFDHFELDNNSAGSNLRITSISGTTSQLWVGTNNGIYRISDDYKNVTAYRHEYFNEHSINDNEIKSLFSEENGFVWIGTINGGINFVNPSKSRFGHISSGYYELNHHKYNVIRAISEDLNGNILIGTRDGGISVFNPETLKFSKFPGALGSQLQGETVNSILFNEETYWIGLRENGLISYNIATKKIQRYLFGKDQGGNLAGENVLSLILTSSGILWIGTNGGGLYELDPVTEEINHYTYNPTGPSSISNNRIYDLMEDSEGNIWIATAGGGLNRFDPKTKEFRSYNKYPDDASGRDFDYILSIHEDKNKTIWAGTFGQGLIQYIAERDSFSFYTENNGLPNNVIYGLEEDDSGNLWLSHNQGITKFNPSNRTFRNYDERDGLQGNEFNSNASFKCRDGKLVFGGINGFNIFYPDSIRINESIPPIVFTNFRISNQKVPIGQMENGRTILESSITHAKEINLLHSDREIYIEFSALDYTVPGKNQYKYRILGRDDRWIDLGVMNHVSFHDLPMGRSTLEVIGSNNDGKWNEEAISLSLFVKPPFYKTALFYFAVIVVFISLFLLYYYIRMKNLRHQKRELEMLIQSKTREIAQQRDILELKNDELESKNLQAREQAEKTAEMADRLAQANQSRLQFFTNITHEFRTPLTLILGFIEKLLAKPVNGNNADVIEDYKMIEKNANKLLKLITRLMQFRKLTTQQTTLRISENNLVDFIRNQAALYKNLADKKEINFTFASREEKLMAWFDHEQMEEVITNLLSNAFKFSPNNSAIKVSVGKGSDTGLIDEFKSQLGNPEQYLYFLIEDNGIGIPEGKQRLVFKRFYQANNHQDVSDQGMGAGIGLHISDMIIKLHKGEIMLKSTPEEGTVFAVILKIGKSHLEEYDFIDQPGTQMRSIVAEEETISMEEKDNEVDAIGATIEQLSKKDLPKILVVEDNSELRKFIIKGLSGSYRVIEAENGSLAVKLLEEQDPEVIICDVMLPGKINGFDLVERTKSNLTTSHIPIILLTALDSVDQKVLGLEKGADIYMTKPFSMRELKAHIQSIIQSRLTLKKKFREQAFMNSRELEISDKDESFIQKTIRIIEAGMSDPQFNVSYLCDAMNMSQTKLYRKVKALTDMTITDFIRGLRLRKASALLLESDKNVSEIAYEVGFNDPNYFGKCFKSQFGLSPSEFIKEQKPG